MGGSLAMHVWSWRLLPRWAQHFKIVAQIASHRQYAYCKRERRKTKKGETKKIFFVFYSTLNIGNDNLWTSKKLLILQSVRTWDANTVHPLLLLVEKVYLLIGGEKCGGYQVEVRMFPKMFPNGENPCLHVLVLANIAAKKWRKQRSKFLYNLALPCCVNIQRAFNYG